MRTLAMDATLMLGLVVGVGCGVWVNRRTDLSFLRERGVSRNVVRLLRAMLFLGALSLVTVPFQLVALAIE